MASTGDSFLRGAASAALTAPALLRKVLLRKKPFTLDPQLPTGLRGAAALETLPGKKPLIKPPGARRITKRRSPISRALHAERRVLRPLSPGEHSGGRRGKWRLKVGGDGAPTADRADARANCKRDFEQVEVAAVCQCSGNRRGMFEPHVPGVEWGLGAMGNARWKGARLKDVLAKAGSRRKRSRSCSTAPIGPVLDRTPDFVKSIPVWKAIDENTLIAYEMNGAPLPHWNGFPARIVVPGWTATYWMKQVTSISAVTKPFDGFWMKSAYRIPRGKFPVVERFCRQETDGQHADHRDGRQFADHARRRRAAASHRASAFEVKGIAWDGGYGIARGRSVGRRRADRGASAPLGHGLGRYSFRPWTFPVRRRSQGRADADGASDERATARRRPSSLIQNPAGYHHNVVQRVTLTVA